MKRIFACIVTITLLGLLGAAPLSAKGENSGELDKGKTLYQEKCQMCHGAGGKGDGPAAASFNPRPYDLATADFWNNNGEKKVKDAIENGFGVMPPIGLKADQTKAVIDYMAHTFKR